MKQTIKIYTNTADPNLLREICFGIEEESVNYEISESQASALAFEAAKASALGVGIGIKNRLAAIHVLPMAQGNLLFNASEKNGRILGQNAARFVKKKSFKL